MLENILNVILIQVRIYEFKEIVTKLLGKDRFKKLRVRVLATNKINVKSSTLNLVSTVKDYEYFRVFVNV